jgi:hypothetical protein
MIYKLIKNDKTGIVHHTGKSYRGPCIYSMCRSFFNYTFKIYTSNLQEDITCRRCRKSLGLPVKNLQKLNTPAC